MKIVIRAFALALLSALCGCVSVRNDTGINPPVALCSNLRATIGCPRTSISCGKAIKKIGHADGSILIKEWVYSGISADVVDLALNMAIADGGINKLYYADYEQTSYLGFVTVFSLVAYGE